MQLDQLLLSIRPESMKIPLCLISNRDIFGLYLDRPIFSYYHINGGRGVEQALAFYPNHGIADASAFVVLE